MGVNAEMEPKKRAPRAVTPPRAASGLSPAPTPEEAIADDKRVRNSQRYQEMQDQLLREKEDRAPTTRSTMGEGRLRPFRAGGAVSASRRADGCAQRGKTRGKMI